MEPTYRLKWLNSEEFSKRMAVLAGISTERFGPEEY
jgi:hypothetical protein